MIGNDLEKVSAILDAKSGTRALCHPLCVCDKCEDIIRRSVLFVNVCMCTCLLLCTVFNSYIIDKYVHLCCLQTCVNVPVYILLCIVFNSYNNIIIII